MVVALPDGIAPDGAVGNGTDGAGAVSVMSPPVGYGGAELAGMVTGGGKAEVETGGGTTAELDSTGAAELAGGLPGTVVTVTVTMPQEQGTSGVSGEEDEMGTSGTVSETGELGYGVSAGMGVVEGTWAPLDSEHGVSWAPLPVGCSWNSPPVLVGTLMPD